MGWLGPPMLLTLHLIRATLVAAACCAVPAWASASASEPGLARDLQALLQEQRLAGAVVATVNGSQAELLGLGVFDTRTRQPLNAGDRVQVGSIAKTVLSLAVLRLVSQGRVELEAPLSALLPAVRLDNPWVASSPVRLRHLLDMTSGLPDLHLWHMFNQGHTAQQPLALALRADAGLIRLRSQPGKQFSYSNLGFTLAGMVIEAVTGERYEDWAERELLQPLAMTGSTFEFRSQGDDPNLAWGHLDNGQPIADWPVAVRPAAQFTTTAADMVRLMRFMLADGRIDSQPFVRSDLMAGLGLSPTTDAARAGLRTGYGLGMFTRDRHGAVGLCHGGSVAGWRAMLCVYRATQQGFFIALNSDREEANYSLFDARLLQHLGLAQPLVDAAAGTASGTAAGTATKAGAAAAAASTELQKAGLSQPQAAQAEQPGELAQPARSDDTAWNGLYVPAPGRLQALALPDRLLGFWWLDLTPGQPTLREGLGPTRKLLPAGNGLYRQADRQQATLVLLRDAEGQAQVSGAYITLRRVSLWEQAALWASVAFGLLGLLALLPLALWRLRCHGLRSASTRGPAAWALLALGTALVAWALQGWQHMAEFSPVTAAVALSSLLLPLACSVQLLQAWRQSQSQSRIESQFMGGTAWEAVAALAGLQLCVLLAVFGWMPLLPWRL